MSDAGFVITGYVLTFVVIAVYVTWLMRRKWILRKILGIHSRNENVPAGQLPGNQEADHHSHMGQTHDEKVNAG